MSPSSRLPLGVCCPGHPCDLRGSRSCRVLWGEGRRCLLPRPGGRGLPPLRGDPVRVLETQLGAGRERVPGVPTCRTSGGTCGRCAAAPPPPRGGTLSPWRRGAAGGPRCRRSAPPYRAAAELSGAGAAPRRATAPGVMGPGGRRAGEGLSQSE